MHSIYRQLCCDHKHMQRLLDVFETLLQQLGKQDRNPATLTMILDALDYLSVYPDQWHHPVEDLVFEQLLGKPVDVRDVINRTFKEHHQIAVATRKMNSLFYAVANDAAVEREQLFGAAREFIELQRRHLQRENEILFPLVAEMLTENDWDDVQNKIQQRQSMHFNTGVKRLYESVYEELAEPAEA
ncbi:hemerythrin domain-containing protein [uncultured Microbulbifer sp.]|uniref:hemerythrin domain-containing protein n=1 Tax=uncultured Microbulbifer sp. TaxID=348147 RepID=UPI0025E6DC29|nr:hemerythrin domain-containing protein [uncultured Microbulbifer sp.]